MANLDLQERKKTSGMKKKKTNINKSEKLTQPQI